MTDIQKRLFSLQDKDYRAFHCRLIPTVDPERVIGVRTPLLRKLAKEIASLKEAEEFLKALPHKYYEENNLHAFLIEALKDYDRAIEAVEGFLPYVDNWATCDSMRPKIFKKDLPDLLKRINSWLSDSHTYTVRFGLNMLMCFYLDDEFKPDYLKLAATVKSEEYYVNMMVAWYFATALAKQYEDVLPIIEGRVLPEWTHNKTIQKAIESYRIAPEQKEYLRTLKIK